MRYARKKRRRSLPTITEISLTPLIDTALTLLVIFMVTTPMIHNTLKVDLPKESIDLPHGKLQEAGDEKKELVVSIDKSGKIYVNDNNVTWASFRNTIVGNLKKDVTSVWLRADEIASCGTFFTIMDELKSIDGVQSVNVETTHKKSMRTA